MIQNCCTWENQNFGSQTQNNTDLICSNNCILTNIKFAELFQDKLKYVYLQCLLINMTTNQTEYTFMFITVLTVIDFYFKYNADLDISTDFHL